MWIIKIVKIKCFYPPRVLEKQWWIYSCLQKPPRENWFQYVRREYATTINFPHIITLVKPKVSIIRYLKFHFGNILYSFHLYTSLGFPLFRCIIFGPNSDQCPFCCDDVIFVGQLSTLWKAYCKLSDKCLGGNRRYWAIKDASFSLV